MDFYSNDYLGFSSSQLIYEKAEKILKLQKLKNGATGSRLLSGNLTIFAETEARVAKFHQSESAILFNSGYDANMGFFSSVPQKGDVILFDEYAHASIRDGLRMSLARSFKFRHNDLGHLRELLVKFQHFDTIYVVTESVFSMDGDSPDVQELLKIVREFQALLVVDEAHAVGVCGKDFKGLFQEESGAVFARIVTFGKAMGCHGAAILGSKILKDYLVNFARSFIYTTAMSPHSVATIAAAYGYFEEILDREPGELQQLRDNLQFFEEEIQKKELSQHFIVSESAIRSCLVPGNDAVKKLSEEMLKSGFIVKPILSPTVPKGEERLRFCIHAYNSQAEISEVLKLLGTFVSKV
ncbi:MAG: aminotransferase class I/II-fold pyridoxal phosphate-dependent enzyme [Bacteroidota bacterium]|nr:aminotransferase class I/II-fold pyridoxal phosphate-dependent enzyme [Bacteroidota bacterium]